MYSTFCRIKIEKKYVNWKTYLLYCPIVVEIDALYIVQWSPSYVVLEKNKKKKEKRMSMYVINLWILVLTAGVVSLLLFEMFYIIIEQQIVSKWCKNGFC